jgi:hypothetical protein
MPAPPGFHLRVPPPHNNHTGPSLAPTRADRAAHSLAPAESSPEPEFQWPPTPAAAALRLRSRPDPNFGHKPIVGEPLAILLPFPGWLRRRMTGILAGAAALHGQGPHCKVQSLSGVFCANWGYRCEELKLPRACSKVEFSNSKWLLLKLWKFVENHRKIRKM